MFLAVVLVSGGEEEEGDSGVLCLEQSTHPRVTSFLVLQDLYSILMYFYVNNSIFFDISLPGL